MQVTWSPSALRQVMQIVAYLDNFNPRAAADVASVLIATADGLADFPYRGRPVRNISVREVMTAYPYIIRYRITRNGVRILRVRHTARRPTSP